MIYLLKLYSYLELRINNRFINYVFQVTSDRNYLFVYSSNNCCKIEKLYFWHQLYFSF